jgi:tetratricopeptide (TPR) repeat protein
MALLDAGLDPTILATDLSEAARELASAGVYEADRVEDLPAKWQRRFFTKTSGGRLRVTAEVRSAVSFAENNLAVSARPPAGWASFDAIVCRNVLLYFERSDASRILSELGEACREDGYILLSAAEHPLAWSVSNLEWERSDQVSLLRRKRPNGRHTPTATPVPASQLEPCPRGKTPAPALQPARGTVPDVDAEIERANAVARGGDAQSALQILKALLARQPMAAAGQLAFGLLLKGMGRIPEATIALRQARFLFGDGSWLAPYTLAVCLDAQNDWREAYEAYRHAIAVIEWHGPSGLSAHDGNEEMLGATVLDSCRQRLEDLDRRREPR